jgi:hypothetical protein
MTSPCADDVAAWHYITKAPPTTCGTGRSGFGAASVENRHLSPIDRGKTDESLLCALRLIASEELCYNAANSQPLEVSSPMRESRILSRERGLIWYMALLAAGVLCLAGCGGDATPSPSPTKGAKAPSTFTPTIEPTPTSEPTMTPTPDLTYRMCPLTGEKPISLKHSNRPPIAIKVENSPAARPQSGLDKADIVFEHVTEGGITRFTAIDLCRDCDTVGPVRSSRLIDLELALAYKAMLGHVGASTPIMEMIAGSDIRDMDEYLGAPGFRRSEDRKAPHNTYADTAIFWETAKSKGWTDKVDLRGLVFSKDPPPSQEKAAQIFIDYSKWCAVDYSYDQESQGYLRSIAGEAHIDKETGYQLLANNVVVLFAETTETDIVEDATGALSLRINLMGRGDITLYRDGLAFPGFWVREERDRTIQFVDRYDNPLFLKEGNTWVQVVPQGFEIEVK